MGSKSGEDGRKLLFVALMLTAVLLTGLVYVTIEGLAGRQAPPDQAPASMAAVEEAVPGQAPDFSLPDLEGDPVSLSQFYGKPVVINFWATWCPPCAAEMPHLVEAYQRERGQVVFLAISVDEPADAVRRFVEEKGVTFTVLLDDDGRIASEYRVNGLPTTFFINRDGEITARYAGQMSPRRIEDGLSRIK